MSVSTAMYAAITGLETMGTAMSVISNNIANMNTVGFKAARANFADLLSQSASSASGSQQIGRGVQLASVTQVFSQGSYQNSTQATDIAISGEGFFKVRDIVTGEVFYTRAGNFIFNKDGLMMTPNGYVLQGWEAVPGTDPVQTTGAETDVIMSSTNVDPEVTDLVTFNVNLDSRETSRYNGPPFSTAWDGSDATSPISGTNYVYQTSVRIYDSLGDGHDLSIYFDPSDTLDNVWDYIVTCDPEDDARLDANGHSVSGSTIAGLLQRGTITFTNTGADGTGGQIYDITADVLSSFTVASAGPASSANVTVGGSYTGASARTYTCTWITSGGGAGALNGPPYPIIHWVDDAAPPNSANVSMVGLGPSTLTNGVTLTFGSATVVSGSNFTFATTPSSTTWSSAVPNNDGYFEFTAAFVTSANPVVPTNQVIALNLGARNPGGANAAWTLDNEATTQYAAPSITLFQTQNGYPSGNLQSVSIDADGVMTGVYSNGRVISNYQIGLALFRNPWGLEKIGNNLYRETRDSGDAVFNRSGTGGVGTIVPNALEQSNVDLAAEFVNMIIQQRGFQANSKIITTTDTMLAELIQLKR